jgi:small subunit ribosomal protein S27Ae
MVVKRKRKRKSIQLKRKINTFIKNYQGSLFHYILLMVINSFILGKGNVTQSRKTCPSCGPGIFMAQHWDRYYCGLCHTTIKMDAETIKKNEEIMKKKKAALEAEKKAKEKEAADKAPAGKGKKDAKKAAKKK